MNALTIRFSFDVARLFYHQFEICCVSFYARIPQALDVSVGFFSACGTRVKPGTFVSTKLFDILKSFCFFNFFYFVDHFVLKHHMSFDARYIEEHCWT